MEANEQREVLSHSGNSVSIPITSKSKGSTGNANSPRGGSTRSTEDATDGIRSSAGSRRKSIEIEGLTPDSESSKLFEEDMRKKMEAQKRSEAAATSSTNKSELRASTSSAGPTSNKQTSPHYNGKMANMHTFPAGGPKKPGLDRPPPTSPILQLPTVARAVDLKKSQPTSPTRYTIKKNDAPSSSGPNAQRQLAASAQKQTAARAEPKSPSKPTKGPFDSVPSEKGVHASNDLQDDIDAYDMTIKAKRQEPAPRKPSSVTIEPLSPKDSELSKESAMVIDAKDEDEELLAGLESAPLPSNALMLSSSSSLSPPSERKAGHLFSNAKIPETKVGKAPTSVGRPPLRSHGLAAAPSSSTRPIKSAPVPKSKSTVRQILDDDDYEAPPVSAPAKSSLASKIDSALSELGEPSPKERETPKRTTRASKKKEVVLIELSDGEDDAPKTPKTAGRRSLLDDIMDPDESFEDDNEQKFGSEASTLPNSTDPETQATFHLPYFQDDVGMGHVSADEPTTDQLKSKVPAGILFDCSLSVTFSKQGISIWKVLPGKKSTGKSPAKKTKTKTPTKKTSEKADVEVMDVDETPSDPPKPTTEEDMDAQEVENLTKVPSSTLTHLLLSHVAPSRILSVDIFAQPGLILMHLTSGKTTALKRTAHNSSSASLSTQTGEDPKTALVSSSKRTPNDKKRTRAQRDTAEAPSNLDTLAPTSKKSSTTQELVDVDAETSKDGENGSAEREPSKSSLDLSYEVGDDDVALVTPQPSTVDKDSKLLVDPFEDKESTRLLIFSLDRQALTPISSLLMQLSKSKPTSLATSSTSDAAESAEKKDNASPNVPATHWFEIFGRASNLTELPQDLVSAWWKPDVVAEADKKVLKSPTRLKPNATPTSSQASLGGAQMPIVATKSRLLAKEKGEEAEYLRNKEQQLSTKYCAPHPIGDLTATIATIAKDYDTLRQEVFGKRWPFELIVPALRGLVASSIVNAPPLYIYADPDLYHNSTLRTSLRSSLRPRKNEKSVPRPSSFLDKDTPVITYPKLLGANSNGEETEEHDDEEAGKSASKSSNMDSVIVRQNDVDRLQPGVFLNDVLVNFYLLYIEHQLMPKAMRKRVKIFSSYFFTLLYEHGYSRVQKWLSQQSIFDYDFVVIPINLHLHWKVAILCNPSNTPETYAVRSKKAKAAASASTDDKGAKEGDAKADSSDAKADATTPSKSNGKHDSGDKDTKDSKSDQTPKRGASNAEDPKQSCILILDSLGSSRDSKIASSIRQMMSEEAKKRDREVVDFDASNLTVYHPRVPQQPNYTDCGLYLLHYVEKFCLDLPADVSKSSVSGGSLMGDDWFPASEVSGKRRTISSCIDSLMKEGYGSKD